MINMITKRQQKIIIFTAVFLLALTVFLVFIYMPADARLKGLKQKYNAIQTEIDEFRRTIGADKPLEQSIIAFRSRIEALGKKFPGKEEIVFKELSSLAQGMDIEITSMNPSKKVVVKGAEGQDLLIKDCVVEEISISMALKTSYKKLGEFLRALKEEFPIFVTIENVNIAKAGDKDSPVLNVALSINTYLISPKPVS
ncbi:MAG: type 4a pilus biogenesis protein PilO [Candidatus Omnitrophota bacterium]|nr:type 4a pilus biogenesis protein PilO [Candidatus Omnitrophota bacterium]